MPRRKKTISEVLLEKTGQSTTSINTNMSVPERQSYSKTIRFNSYTWRNSLYQRMVTGSKFEERCLCEQTFVGYGDTPIAAKINCMQQIIDACILKLNTTITNQLERRSFEEICVWATQFKAALENGISTSYQYPEKISQWRTTVTIHGSSYDSEENFRPRPYTKKHGWWPIDKDDNLIPSFPFYGFGRSPKEAECNALKALLIQYTLRLRKAPKNSELAKNLKEGIDTLNEKLEKLSANLDIFEQIKGIRNPKEAWSDGPKPSESKPVRVPKSSHSTENKDVPSTV